MGKKTIFINYDADIMHATTLEAKENYIITRILKERYDVVFSENPDYVIVSGYDHGFNYRYINENAVLIQYQGEAVVPNFNLCDYGIGFDDLSFGDRYLKFDDYFVYHAEYDEKPGLSETLSDRKFCSFLVGNADAKERQVFFQKLSQYKQADSGGHVLNNIGRIIPPGSEAKINFLCDYKFNIAFENALFRGYTTEKIADAFHAHTIPIYWGNPDVAEYYDTNSFINCHDYNNFEEVIEKIIELDKDPVLYMNMLRTVPVDKQAIDKEYQKLREFLFHIFDQPLHEARRRGVGTSHRNILRFFKSLTLPRSYKHHVLALCIILARKIHLYKVLRFMYRTLTQKKRK